MTLVQLSTRQHTRSATTPQRAAIYVRQSQDAAKDGAAVARQQEACQQLARARGWAVSRVYVDNDRSASRGSRPAWRELLADVERGGVDVVVAYHVDRLARRVAELEQLVELSVPVACVAGDLDTSTDAGRLVARILGAVAQGEAERKAARQRTANAQRREQGVSVRSGRRPFGYFKGGEQLHPVESVVVHEAFERVAAGGSLREVCRTWNAAGHTTSHGGPWRADGLRRLLLNPRYEAAAPATWPAIVSADLAAAVRSVLTNPARRTAPSNRARFLLSGIARCGVCHGPMRSGRTSRGLRSLRCQEHHVVRAAEPIEAFVADVVVTRLQRADAADLVGEDSSERVRELRVQLTALTARAEDAAAAFADGLLDGGQLRVITARVREQREAAEAELATLVQAASVAAVAGLTRQAWQDLGIDRQRAVVDALCVVRVQSAGRGKRGFDPETVQIAWR